MDEIAVPHKTQLQEQMNCDPRQKRHTKMSLFVICGPRQKRNTKMSLF